LSEDVRKEWLRRAELCGQRRADLYDSHVKSRQAATRSTDDEKADNCDEVLQEPESSEDSIEFNNALVTEALDLDVGSLPDQVSVLAELLEDEEADAEMSKETSGNRIKAYRTLTKRLLLANVDFNAKLDEAIRSSWKGTNPPTDDEVKILVKCIKSIKPYIPPPDAPKCVSWRIFLWCYSPTSSSALQAIKLSPGRSAHLQVLHQ
jgi:hypothetical protein